MTTYALAETAQTRLQLYGKLIKNDEERLCKEERDDVWSLEFNTILAFDIMTMRYFGMTRQDIQQLSNKELAELFSMVLEESTKSVSRLKLSLLIPVFGWAYYVICRLHSEPVRDAVKFVRLVAKLKSAQGECSRPDKMLRRHQLIWWKPNDPEEFFDKWD